MTVKDFKRKMDGNFFDDFEVRLQLDHCESPNTIRFKFDVKKRIVTIIQGNCGL